MARTIDDLVKIMLGGTYVKAKYFRRAIDRNPDIRQRLELHGDYKKRFDAFAKAARKAMKEGGPRSFFEFEGQRFQARSALRTVGAVNNRAQQDVGRANFAQTRNTLTRLFPDLVEGNDLGHENISVARAMIAATLNSMPEGPQRQALKALYVVVQEIDAIIDPGEEDLATILEKIDKAAASGLNVRADFQKDVKIATGQLGSINLVLEAREINRYKGFLAGVVSQVFRDVIEGRMDSFAKFIGGNANLLEIKGSPSIIEDLTDSFVEKLDPKKKPRKRKSSSTTNTKTRGPRVKTKKPKGAKHRAPRTRAQPGVSSEPLALIGVINQALPGVVRQNMGDPRLNNRTGTFASSVRVTDMTMTPQGFPSIGYTYQKNPYQTFEVGYAQGSPDRDPRSLIDGSIREIAAKFALGRIYTRRT